MRNEKILCVCDNVNLALYTLIYLNHNFFSVDDEIPEIKIIIFSILAFQSASNQPDILPFSVSGFNHHKNRVFLTRLIQGNANQFPNGTLTVIEEVWKEFE